MTTLIKSVIKRIPGARRIGNPIFSTQLLILRLVHGEETYRKAVFKKIWTDNHWGDAESRSGSGSNLEETEEVRNQLADLLKSLGVRDLLDLPCGDFHWMKEVQFPSALRYVGGDLVEQIVEKNRSVYGNERRHFRTIDILQDTLPGADMILCRDCLVHFSFADIFAAVANLKRSGAKYLLTTHFMAAGRRNSEIFTGQWRALNLTQPPLAFPEPLLVIQEQCSEAGGKFGDKCLGLWQLEDLPDHT